MVQYWGICLDGILKKTYSYVLLVRVCIFGKDSSSFTCNFESLYMNILFLAKKRKIVSVVETLAMFGQLLIEICWLNRWYFGFESVLKDVSNFYLFWMWDNTLSLIWLNLGCFISVSVYPCIHLHSFLVFEGGKASTFKIFSFSQTEVKYLIEVQLLWKNCYELLIYLRL